MDSSQGQHSSWIDLGTIFDVLCLQNQSCSSFQHCCANPCSKGAFFPDSQKFLWSLPFAFVWAEMTKHRFSGAAEEAVSWLAAQLAQHLLPYHRRWPQLHRGSSGRQIFFALESVVIQPLAFINVLSELVNFILNEACQVNPPASVTLTNNSTFPLFPWLIISKKWQNLLRIFSLKSTDMVKGASVWMKIFQSYEHMKNWFYDGTRILNSITKALLQLYSYVWRQSFPLSAVV